ncbi:hypothetical protein PybrP1_004135 [[Pythium] brassicae (nom. inval.)]|nr:hypothetical protein PybrP1_004135 [[Pythium] brassicae (nom. inval.)]
MPRSSETASLLGDYHRIGGVPTPRSTYGSGGGSSRHEEAMHIGAGKRFASFQTLAVAAGGKLFGYAVAAITALGAFGGCVGSIRIAPFLTSKLYTLVEKVRKRKSASAAQLIPESFNHYHRAIECPAQINARVKKDEQGNPWHNHEVSAAIYSGYPEVRNAYPPEVLATVNVLRKAEALRKKIHEYMVENTAHDVKMKDVHNLLSKLSRTDGCS